MKGFFITTLTLSIFMSSLASAGALNDLYKNSVFKDGAMVSSVNIILDREQIDPKGQYILRQNNVVPKLKESILSLLKSKEKFDQNGSIKVDIVIKQFYLISMGKAVVFGLLAGGDILGANVLVLKEKQPFKEFVERTVGRGGIFSGSDEGRISRLISSFKWHLFNKLRGLDLPKDTTPRRGVFNKSGPQGVTMEEKTVQTDSVGASTDKIISTKSRLKELKALYEENLITKEEYKEKKLKILNSL